MKEFEPELGQAVFGQPFKKFQLSIDEEIALDCLSIAWNIFVSRNGSPWSNSGTRYNGTNFICHAYSWNNEEEQKFNFKWRDWEVSWYKYVGRGSSVNRNLSNQELKEMLKDCLPEIMK